MQPIRKIEAFMERHPDTRKYLECYLKADQRELEVMARFLEKMERKSTEELERIEITIELLMRLEAR